jgi:hypothetical protein
MMSPPEVKTQPRKAIPESQYEYILDILARVENGVQSNQDTLQSLIVEYQKEHTRVVGMVQNAHERIDRLEVDVAELTKCVQQMKDLIQPVLFVNKILAWVLVAFGVSIIALIFAIITHQVSMVFP